MRSLIVLVLVAAACKGKDADVDRYANTEMSTSLVRLVQAGWDVDHLRAGDVNEPDTLRHLRHARKTLRAAREAASKVVPPKALATLHADLLGLLTEKEASIGELVAAAEIGDGTKFATAHARLMDAATSQLRWGDAFDAALADKNIKEVKLPELPELADDPPPPLCVPGTEVKSQSAIVACELVTSTAISRIRCSPGKATFFADGELASCITDAEFVLPYKTPPPALEVVICGPGPVSRRETGGVASCVMRGNIRRGDTDLDRGTTVTFDDKLRVVSATAPDGKKQCFDEPGKLVACR